MTIKNTLLTLFCLHSILFTSFGQDKTTFETEIIPKNHFDLSILQVFPDSFPLVSVVFQAKDGLGNPLKLIKKEELGVKENGLWAEVISLRNITENEPIKITIVLDKSSSMLLDANQIGDVWIFDPRKAPKGYISPITYAKEGIKQFIKSGELAQDSLQLIGFNERVNQVSKFSNQPDYLLKFLSKMHPEGATAFYDAIKVAVNSLEGMEGEKAIIALTDGLDNSSTISRSEVGKLAASAEIPIYTIGFGGADSLALDSLTLATHGFSYFTNDPKQLASIYLQIKQQIRSIYELRYQSQTLDNLSDERDIEFYFANDSLVFDDPKVAYQLPSKAKTFLEERKKALDLRNNLIIGAGIGTFILLGLTAFFILRKKKNKLLKVYPNPFENSFTLDYELHSAEGVLQVLDESGNVHATILLTKGKQQRQIEGKDWPTGTYLIRIAAGDQLSEVKRMFKI